VLYQILLKSISIANYKWGHPKHDGTGQPGQAVNQADGTPKGFEDISIATERASK